MSSYQTPIKHNNEFSTIFNNVDYDVSLSSKSNMVRAQSLAFLYLVAPLPAGPHRS